MLLGLIFLNKLIQAFYLHPLAWLLLKNYPGFYFSNGITLQNRTLIEKKLHNAWLDGAGIIGNRWINGRYEKKNIND